MIQLPEKPKVVSKEKNKAVFEITPLHPGYGLTIGNALRRVLLSSLEGVAITSIKISGVNHEFSTIPGVLEDVIEIILNIKKIRIKSDTQDPITLNIKVKGEKEVTAEDISVPAGAEIINTKQKIATITDKKAEFEVEMVAERGIGYSQIEHREKEKLSVGMITVDAIFSPVEFANITTENIRVGNRTDYNKLLLDIRTDGTITPQEALDQGCKVLLDHFQIISGGKVETPKAKEE
jgi:DNA-directed RNA polymerase subunit alpha